ncbi:hypothetical protein RF11_14210 [Thelohanellus kitauei]|uniref:ISXO2-like transposase domain-containing protein n=1 Tax=Thelohanellus kitauei TaxID=669202 RepID=A0A0C2MPP1_THEKT|nr:hypothetical protein RF11_14210 [Thelohanellus kitauei]
MRNQNKLDHNYIFKDDLLTDIEPGAFFLRDLSDFARRRKGNIVFARKNIVPALNSYPACNGTGIKRRGRNWRCSSKYCRKEYSVFKNTLFSIIQLKINEHKQLCLITGHSPSTITYIMRYLRKMVGASLDFEDCTICGHDITVEIDESKLGKNKYHREHLVSGAWVLGGVKKTRERMAFLV